MNEVWAGLLGLIATTAISGGFGAWVSSIQSRAKIKQDAQQLQAQNEKSAMELKHKNELAIIAREAQFETNFQDLQKTVLGQLSDVIDQRDQAEKDKNQLVKKYEAAIDGATRNAELYSNANTEIELKDQIIKQMQENLDRSHDLIKQAMEQIEKSAKQEARLDSRLAEMERQIKMIDKITQDLQAELNETHLQLDAALKGKATLEKQLETERLKSAKAEKRNQELQVMIEELKTRIAKLEGEREQLRLEMDALKPQIEEMEKEV